MYADYFHLDLHTRLEKVQHTSTKFIVVANLVWEKQCMLRSKVETESVNGIKKYYETAVAELMEGKTQGGKCYWKKP